MSLECYGFETSLHTYMRSLIKLIQRSILFIAGKITGFPVIEKYVNELHEWEINKIRN